MRNLSGALVIVSLIVCPGISQAEFDGPTAPPPEMHDHYLDESDCDAHRPAEFMHPDKVFEVIVMECSQGQEECDDGHFECGLKLLHQLMHDGKLWHPDFVRMTYDIRMKKVHLHAFHEGLELGMQECFGGPKPHPGDDPYNGPKDPEKDCQEYPEGKCPEGPGPGDPEHPEDPVDGDKIEVCHIPPGNSKNAHTILIPEAALKAHMAHGDTVGACEDDAGADPDDGSGKGDKTKKPDGKEKKGKNGKKGNSKKNKLKKKGFKGSKKSKA